MNTHTVEELYRLAQQGNTEALTRLGICYKNGTGTAMDHSAAAQCFYSAANAGNAEAQYQLGICYEEGIGLEQDMSAAGYWFQEAARRFYEAAQVGNPQAQYGLANCYAEGRGVEKDEAAAVYWYQASAQQDYADAQYNFCLLYTSSKVRLAAFVAPEAVSKLKKDIESLNQEKESAIQEEAFEKAGEIKKKQDRKQARCV